MKRLPSIIVTMGAVLALGMPALVAAQGHQRGGGGRTSGGGGGGGGDHAVPRGDSGSGGGSGSAPQPVSAGRAAAPQRGSEAERGGERAQPTSRQRGGQATNDVAVVRRGGPPHGNGPIFINNGYYGGYYPGVGYYPWGYGGYGFGGYYGGYYDPWFYGSVNVGYGGYGGGYGGYGGYGGGYYPGSYSGLEEGALRIKMTPRDASVYVDGYFAGQVDDFDGTFQRLRVGPGPHRIEVRADGYSPLSYEVQVPPGRTVNYSGELKRLP